MLGVRIDAELEKRLSRYAKRSKQNKSACVKEAIRIFLDKKEQEAWHRRQTLQGLREIADGFGMSAQEAFAHLNMWGEK